MKHEIRYVLLASPFEEFAHAVDELGWERRPTPCFEGVCAAWEPDDGGEVLWIEPASAPAPVLRLMGKDLEQLEQDLDFLAGVRGSAILIDLIAGTSDHAELIALIRLAGLLARGPYDPALGDVLANALTAGDCEMQAAVADGLRWTEWRELAAPILQSLQMSPISQDVKGRLESIADRLSSN